MKVLQAAEIDKLDFECHLGVAYETRLAFCSAKREYRKKGRREKGEDNTTSPTTPPQPKLLGISGWSAPHCSPLRQ